MRVDRRAHKDDGGFLLLGLDGVGDLSANICGSCPVGAANVGAVALDGASKMSIDLYAAINRFSRASKWTMRKTIVSGVDCHPAALFQNGERTSRHPLPPESHPGAT